MAEEDNEDMICDVCGAAGSATVSASGLGPASFAYCPSCIARHAEPFMMVATSIFVAGGPVDGCLDDLADVVTFADGHYVGLDAVLARYDDALEAEIREAFFG